MNSKQQNNFLTDSFPISALPPNAVVYIPASDFINLIEEVRAIRQEVREFRDRIDKLGLTRQQIAEMTGRSLHTVGEWVREGKVVEGKRVRLNENALTGLTTVSDFNAFYELFNSR